MCNYFENEKDENEKEQNSNGEGKNEIWMNHSSIINTLIPKNQKNQNIGIRLSNMEWQLHLWYLIKFCQNLEIKTSHIQGNSSKGISPAMY